MRRGSTRSEPRGSERMAAVPNIGPLGQRRRRLVGVVALTAGVVLAVALVTTGQERAWRLTVFLPFWLAALGLLQAREKT